MSESIPQGNIACHPRHMLPLVPLVFCVLAVGRRLRRRQRATATPACMLEAPLLLPLLPLAARILLDIGMDMAAAMGLPSRTALFLAARMRSKRTPSCVATCGSATRCLPVARQQQLMELSFDYPARLRIQRFQRAAATLRRGGWIWERPPWHIRSRLAPTDLLTRPCKTQHWQWQRTSRSPK